MSQHSTHPYWRTVLFFALLLTVFLATQSARAEGFVYGDTVAADETVPTDIVLQGDDIVLDGAVEGDVFAFGRNITINGTVGGSLFIIGDKIALNGQVDGSLYALAVGMVMGENSLISRSVYYLGMSLHTEAGALIEQNLTAVAFGTRQAGDVQGQSKVISGLYEIGMALWNQIQERAAAGSLDVAAKPQPIAQTTDGATQLAAMPLYQTSADDDDTPMEQTADLLIDSVRQMASFLIVGGLALWLMPVLFTSWATEIQRKPLHSFGLGFVALIVGFVGTIMLLVLIGAMSASLGYASLWGLAVTWLGLAVSLVGVGFWGFFLFMAYMSQAIVAYVIGFLILNRLAPKVAARRFWPLLLGLLIFVLLAMLPYVGFVVAFVAACLGLGGVWLAWNHRDGAAPETAVADPELPIAAEPA
jgi:hypothetical protein